LPAAALAGLETARRRQCGDDAPFSVADAVARVVKFRTPVAPRPDWRSAYDDGLRVFERRLAHG
jgi:hypothetical protein